MKLYGKKVLAMILTIAMVLSVCSFSVFATDDPGEGGTDIGSDDIVPGEGGSGEGGSGEGGETPEPQPVPVESISITSSVTEIYMGTTAALTAQVLPENADNKACVWTSSNSSVLTVNPLSGAITAGTVTEDTQVTVTVTASGDPSKTASVVITVKKDTIASASAPSAEAVPYGTSEAAVKTILSGKNINVTYSKGAIGQVKIPAANWVAKGTAFNPKIPGDYTFTGTVTEGVAVDAVVTVNKATLSGSSNVINKIQVPKGGALNWNQFPSTVAVTLNNNEPKTFTIGNTGDFAFWTCSNFNQNVPGVYEFAATASSATSAIYNIPQLVIQVTVYDPLYNVTSSVSHTGMQLSDIAASINSQLTSIFGSNGGLYYAYFTGMKMDGGTLYTDSSRSTEITASSTSNKHYLANDLSNMFYMPNGSGLDSKISYAAYNATGAYIYGEITFKSGSFILIDLGDITIDDTVSLSSAQIQNAIDEWEIAASTALDYTLDYVTFANPGYGKGNIYNGDSKIAYTSSTGSYVQEKYKFYADSRSANYIDNLTYIPDERTSDMVTLTFTANTFAGSYTRSYTLTGYILMNVVEKADITIETGINQSVNIPAELFQNYLSEKRDSASRKYEVVAVKFNNAPTSDTKGYFMVGNKKLTNPDSYKFYTLSETAGDYALSDLAFVGGTTEGITQATFTIYYVQTGKTYVSALPSGKINFAVGTSYNPNGTLMASETMSFSSSLELFWGLGDGENEYVMFTNLPEGGKLVYNWGEPNQEDVTAGTAYYILSTPGQKLLSNVTFVPGYSADKTEKNISIGFKAVNSRGKASTGTITITVNHAAFSMQFNDVTDMTYADSVDFLLGQGITKGTSETTFNPAGKVKRAEFVTFLWRAAGEPKVTGVTNKFTDVKSTGTYAYAYDAILWAVQNGITQGRSATSFAPGADVTYQEIMQFLYNFDVKYLKHPGTQGNPNYIYDYAQVTWGKEAVNWAVYKQIFTYGYLKPNTAGTRADVALYLHRMLTL